MHAENDWDIPYTHSEELFSTLLSPLLPPLPPPPSVPSTWTADDWTVYKSKTSERVAAIEKLVTHTEVPKFGTLDVFRRPGTGNKVTLLKTLVGEHDRIGSLEGVQDIIAQLYK